MSQAAFYKWRQRFNGMDATELKRIKELGRRESSAQSDVRWIGTGLKTSSINGPDADARLRVWKKALKPCQKRKPVKEVYQQPQVGINRAYRVLSLSKSVYYYPSHKDDQIVEDALRQEAEQHLR